MIEISKKSPDELTLLWNWIKRAFFLKQIDLAYSVR